MQNNPFMPDPQQNVPPRVQTNGATSPRQNIPPNSPYGPFPTTPLGTSLNDAPGSAQTPPSGTPFRNAASPLSKSPLGTQPNGAPKSAQTPSLQDIKPIRSDYPAKLVLVDNGRVVEALKSLRDNCEKTSPNEIYLVLNPSGVTEAAEAQFSQKAHSLEGWRNSLILLPIMVTWISLGLAGLAYTQSIIANPKLVAEPLLQQWAEGFTILKYVSVWTFHVPLVLGQWRYFSFGDVAVLDFILFVMLLILTVRVQVVEAQAAKDANELGTWLREECDILRAHTYARVVGQGYGGDTPEWAVLVNKSIANLQGVMKDVTTLIHSFGDVLNDDRAIVTKALTAVDNLNAIYEGGRRTYEKLDAILLEMNTSFKTMADSQAESVRSLDKIATAVNASSDAVVQLAQPFATVGVAQLARETFSTLQQTQGQQKYINDTVAKQLATIGQMKFGLHQPSVYRWWDVRRFFTRFRR